MLEKSKRFIYFFGRELSSQTLIGVWSLFFMSFNCRINVGEECKNLFFMALTCQINIGEEYEF